MANETLKTTPPAPGDSFKHDDAGAEFQFTVSLDGGGDGLSNAGTDLFRIDLDPKNEVYCTYKRNMLIDHQSQARRLPADDPVKTKRARESLKAGMLNNPCLIKSTADSHSAQKLCNSDTSAGSSFVSHKERKFCYIATKILYNFGEIIESGHCWDDKQHQISTKGNTVGLRLAAKLSLRFFERTFKWRN